MAQTRAETEQRTAQAAAVAAEATVEQLRAELKETRQRHRDELAGVRRDARAEREQLRGDHLAQLADVKQAAEERVAALTAALRSAEQVSEVLRRQLGDEPPAAGDGDTAGSGRRSNRKSRGSEDPT
jgi:cell division septum initiation protein DivIVA